MTGSVPVGRIERGMRGFLQRRSRPIGWALIAGLVLAFVVNCAPMAEAAPTQKACCAAMGHDCGPRQELDCCAAESARLESVAAVNQLLPPSPGFDTPALVLPALVPSSTQILRTDREGANSHFTRVPTYLRFSVLLL